ncbi:MAG: hypothetical protein LUD78_09050, partial [Clostridiales bacterium]|nr:hypothetical protein [Clostridiales bacterium]
MKEKTAVVHGFDESTNYLAYPTLMPLPQRRSAHGADLEERVQQLLEESQKRAAALERLEAEVQRLRAEEQKGAEELRLLQAKLEHRQTAQP